MTISGVLFLFYLMHWEILKSLNETFKREPKEELVEQIAVNVISTAQ